MSLPSWTSLPAAGLAGALLGALFAASARPAGGQEAERTHPPEARIRPEPRLVPQRQWEYKQPPCMPTAPLARERSDLADRLNEEGKRGWELVSLVELWPTTGRECLLATFKRQLLN
jgi:hypothetical protein